MNWVSANIYNTSTMQSKWNSLEDCVYTEVLCPVPELEHAHLGDVMNRTEYELESLVSVTCEQGYGFSERLVPPIKQYNCTKQGWQEIIEEGEPSKKYRSQSICLKSIQLLVPMSSAFVADKKP